MFPLGLSPDSVLQVLIPGSMFTLLLSSLIRMNSVLAWTSVGFTLVVLVIRKPLC